MADPDAPPLRRPGATLPPPTSDPGSIGDLVDAVKAYAKQETLDPLRGALRWLGFGVAAAISLGTGAALLVLALLRLLQEEMAPTFDGRWMTLVPYAAALVASLIVIGLAVARIAKKTLNQPE